MYRYEDIREIHLEITERCQAACSMCGRFKTNGDINPHLTLAELSLEDCQQIFPAQFINQLNHMYMCGNWGDPIIARDTLAVFEYFRKHNTGMKLGMHTNAGARPITWWQELARIFGEHGVVIFSIDGLQDTNHIYRRNVQWGKVTQSVRAFIEAGGRARWDFLVFEHNEHQVELAEEISKRMGFERFVAKKSARFLKDNNSNVNSPKSLKYQNLDLRKVDPLIDHYGSLDKFYDQSTIQCKVQNGNLFITAEGLAMPCCWTAGRMYQANYPAKDSQIWEFIDAAGGVQALDARQGLQTVFDTGIFDKIEASWQKPSCKQGKLKVCAEKCSLNFNPFDAQFSNA